jgi:hypothetical protein
MGGITFPQALADGLLDLRSGRNPVDPADESAIWPYENSANKSTPDALRLAVPTLEIQLNRAGTKVAKDSEPLWWYPKKTYVTNTEAYKDIPHTWVCRKCVPEREVVPV